MSVYGEWVTAHTARPALVRILTKPEWRWMFGGIRREWWLEKKTCLKEKEVQSIIGLFSVFSPLVWIRGGSQAGFGTHGNYPI